MENTLMDPVESEPGIFGLLTALTERIALKSCSNGKINHKRLSKKMRSYCYEIILKKSNEDVPSCCSEPMVGLYSYFLASQQSIKNVAEHRKNTELKSIIDNMRSFDFGENRDSVYSVIKLLVGLNNSIKEDLGTEIYKTPFSFGCLDKILPRPPMATYGSPEPYPYFPPHIFELPFSLGKRDLPPENHAQSYTQYTVETFDSRSYLPDTITNSQASDLRVFVSPMSVPSLTSTQLSLYSSPTSLDCGRITGPRDLAIPRDCLKVTVTMPESDVDIAVKEVYRAESGVVDIWEIATQIDKNIPDDLWDIAAKLPPIRERQFISTSVREMDLWREIHSHELAHLSVISEKCFIRHVMYLIIGIETSSFPYNPETGCFKMKNDLVLEGVSKFHLRRYVSDLLLVGTYYKRLHNFAFNHSLEDHFQSNGYVYEAAREVICGYLLEFRMKATGIYEDICNDETGYIPTLLQILYHIEPLKSQMETIVSIYKLIDPDSMNSLPSGAELMSYLFNEISLVTNDKTSLIMHKALISVCKVYFKFIERFIFEGELLDEYREFFIRKDSHFVHCKSKRYWDKGFHITESVAVPEFLRNLAKLILLCGKSLRLLKLCNPSDPLILLISSDHPLVKCCSSFSELERQQQLLDVYRTRCLFVSGEPVTFDQILLKREAEKKAFTEMASLKQTETMEKIVAERKRLAQLIIAEKQHSLRILEAAMAEAKAAKQKSRLRDRKLQELEKAEQKAKEEVDSRLREEEKDKIMEYYSKLNMAVEKSKLHTEWKIKRLQLDQSRMQLLSAEERNLKREKLELQIQMNEDVMSMSIQSLDTANDTDITDNEGEQTVDIQDDDSQKYLEFQDTVEEMNDETTINKPSKSTDLISAICNVAKTLFGVSQDYDSTNCDNNKELDAQGNILPTNKGESQFMDQFVRYPDVFDNDAYLQTKKEALMNKEKVLAHEFGSKDKENNEITSLLDAENNFKDPTNPFEEAKRNKIKVLGSEAQSGTSVVRTASEPKTEAQKEAILNRQKVLGVEFNLPAEPYVRKEPANYAQEQACVNKTKMMTSENETMWKEQSPKRKAKRSALTLNLKPHSDPMVGQSLTLTTGGITPNTGAITPAEFFPRLDLETPTAEVLFDGGIGDVFTPKTEDKDTESENSKNEKPFIRPEGFDFPLVVDEETVDGDGYASSEASPVKTIDTESQLTNRSNYSVFNLLDGSYSLDNFDPFAVKSLTKFTSNHFNRQLDCEVFNSSSYTHPSIIMEEVKKKPYANIFVTNFICEDKDDGVSVDNIATLTACLQRSVMLPLTYQLEIVNNSILTYFLVNLDMYEHMRSLKDYFFLMDGEFSRSICNNLFTKLVQTLNPQELLNFATLHSILDKALGSSISHVHKFSENLSFTISDIPLSFHHSSPNVLQCLSLTYTVSWPLNIILSQEALARYAKVFQFLIKMRRISWVLREDFESLKLTVKLSKEHSRTLLRSPQYMSIQIYRHNMASLVRALDNYIVTTCILSSWTEFENDLKKARTLDDLYECHVVYVKKVLFRCLLNNRSTPIMKLLNDIFTVILKFSRVLKAGEWKQREPNARFMHTNYAQLAEIYHLFEKLAKYIHKVITKLMECGYQRHLVELLTMVNLNHYYDADKKGDPNVSVQSP